MGVQKQIDRLTTAKAGIAQAVGEKGVDIPASTSLSDYPDYIRQIETGAVWYGIEFDTEISDPTCTRIGNLDFHRILPIHNQIKGCLLNDDGQVVKYLNPTDWTGETRDGSLGQVMVELPEHYRKFESEGTKRRVCISLYPLPGYHLVGKRYVSAYEATLQRSTNKLASVVNTSMDYRGGVYSEIVSVTDKTGLGLPLTSLTISNFRNCARRRKTGSTEWNIMTYDIHKELYWLAVIEYATLNLQQEPNAEKDQNGYKQGGLGKGVAFGDASDWGEFNDYSPFIPCGHTDSIGNGSGQIDYIIFISKLNAKLFHVPRYRGVENPFGHIGEMADGLGAEFNPDAPYDFPYIWGCNDPSKFNDWCNGYTHIGFGVKTYGYVKDVIFGDGGEIVASALGGGSTTYFCAYHNGFLEKSIHPNMAVLGGDALGKEYSNFAYMSLNNVYASWDSRRGSRLCFIPQN